MNVRETYKKHKISAERRKFSQKLLKSLRLLKNKSISEGEVYCIRYVSKDLPTDKWHAIAVVFVTEISFTEIVGYNLLYLPEEISLRILEKAEFVKQFSKSQLKAIMDNELTKKPWSYSMKVFQITKIDSFSKIEREDWGMIPVMEKSMFGNLNGKQLIADWKLENVAVFSNIKKKDREVKEKAASYEIEEGDTGKAVIFEDLKKTSFYDDDKEIVDLDDDI